MKFSAPNISINAHQISKFEPSRLVFMPIHVNFTPFLPPKTPPKFQFSVFQILSSMSATYQNLCKIDQIVESLYPYVWFSPFFATKVAVKIWNSVSQIFLSTPTTYQTLSKVYQVVQFLNPYLWTFTVFRHQICRENFEIQYSWYFHQCQPHIKIWAKSTK